MHRAANRVIIEEIKEENQQPSEIAYGFANTEFGEVFLSFLEENNAVCLLHFVEKGNKEACRQYLRKHWPQSILVENPKLTHQMAELIFNNDVKTATIEVVTCGSPFQQLVWQSLLKIPVGSHCTYNEIAEMIDKPSAVLAVANAVAANEVSVLIPCHRVIPKKHGNQFKYRWGGDIKRKLLESEGIVFKD